MFTIRSPSRLYMSKRHQITYNSWANISRWRGSEHPLAGDCQADEKWTIIHWPLGDNNTLSLSLADWPTKAKWHSVNVSLFPAQFPFQKQKGIALIVSQPWAKNWPAPIIRDVLLQRCLQLCWSGTLTGLQVDCDWGIRWSHEWWLTSQGC